MKCAWQSVGAFCCAKILTEFCKGMICGHHNSVLTQDGAWTIGKVVALKSRLLWCIHWSSSIVGTVVENDRSVSPGGRLGSHTG